MRFPVESNHFHFLQVRPCLCWVNFVFQFSTQLYDVFNIMLSQGESVADIFVVSASLPNCLTPKFLAMGDAGGGLGGLFKSLVAGG